MTQIKKGYYDITCAMERFEDSPRATEYLQNIIEEQSPDSFHWIDYAEAHILMALDIKEGKLLP